MVTSKFPMHLIRCFFVSLMGLFKRVKMASKVFTFSVYLNPCSPFSTRFDLGNTFVSRCIRFWNFSVCSILNMIAFSQIIGTIICAIAINMVNQLLWPTSSYKKPSQSLSIIKSIINTNSNIPISVETTSGHALLSASPSIYFPCKVSGFWVIIQKFKNAAHCDFIFHNIIMSSQMTLVK